MPIYDYQCTSCGFKDEVMRKISASPVEACPKCAQETFAKQVSAPSFQLTGSGWYATDFKNGGKKPAAKASDTTTETKPADTPAAAPCNTGCACH